jgi:hypothetical protein
MLNMQAERYESSDASVDNSIERHYREIHESHEKLLASLKHSRAARRKRDLETTLEFFLTEVNKRRATTGNHGSWWESAEDFLLSLHQSGSGSVPSQQTQNAVHGDAPTVPLGDAATTNLSMNE